MWETVALSDPIVDPDVTVTVSAAAAMNIGGAMVERAARLISQQQRVPAFIHGYAKAWDEGLSYDRGTSFWMAVVNHNPATAEAIRRR